MDTLVGRPERSLAVELRNALLWGPGALLGLVPLCDRRTWLWMVARQVMNALGGLQRAMGRPDPRLGGDSGERARFVAQGEFFHRMCGIREGFDGRPPARVCARMGRSWVGRAHVLVKTFL